MTGTNKSIMAVGAHADDIEFNATGTLLKYRKAGYSVDYVMATNNCAGVWWKLDRNGKRYFEEVPWYVLMPQRKREAAKAAAELFGTVPVHLDYAQRHYWDRDSKKTELRYGCAPLNCSGPDVPTIVTACEDPAAIERLANLILERNPECVLTHGYAVYTVEHYCTATLTRMAYFKACEQGYGGSLLHWIEAQTYLYGGGFVRWDTFVDTTGYGSKVKKKAIEFHSCQMPTSEFLDLEDEIFGKECACESAEPYLVCRLAKENPGALTKELFSHLRYEQRQPSAEGI